MKILSTWFLATFLLAPLTGCGKNDDSRQAMPPAPTSDATEGDSGSLTGGEASSDLSADAMPSSLPTTGGGASPSNAGGASDVPAVREEPVSPQQAPKELQESGQSGT